MSRRRPGRKVSGVQAIVGDVLTAASAPATHNAMHIRARCLGIAQRRRPARAYATAHLWQDSGRPAAASSASRSSCGRPCTVAHIQTGIGMEIDLDRIGGMVILLVRITSGCLAHLSERERERERERSHSGPPGRQRRRQTGSRNRQRDDQSRASLSARPAPRLEAPDDDANAPRRLVRVVDPCSH
jgi:hypothetical protein